MTSPKEIIPRVSRELIRSELNDQLFVRHTNKGNNRIYIINQKNAPNVMLEIGRLREVTFRASGGGTGNAYDIDEFDTTENGYEQLIVYSPDEEEIIGGYRFIEGKKAMAGHPEKPRLSTANYFTFTPKFIQEYLPYTMELGRSWVQPDYQPLINPRKGVFALDNIWDGLGALSLNHPEIRYFFGKVTMYTSYNRYARDLILCFLKTFFPDKEDLLHPYHPLPLYHNEEELQKNFRGLNFNDAYKVLKQLVRNLGENIPPLMNIYMNLSPTMKTFGTASNPHFGDVEETGILVTIADIYSEKKERHLSHPKR